MHRKRYMPVRGHCMQHCGCQLNPLDTMNTVIAGAACDTCMVTKDACPMPLASEAMEAPLEEDCLLAAAYIADQQYLAGYCPSETLRQGTLFPELVRPYTN